MQGFSKIIQQFPDHAEIIIAFAKLEKHLFLVLDESGALLGCNHSTYEALGFSTYDEFLSFYNNDIANIVMPKEGCVDPLRQDWISNIEEDGDHCINIKNKMDETFLCSLRLQSFALNGVVLHLLLLENQFIIEQAKKAHAYFESMKKQFLTNISHEFRTPMNSIVGYSELLKETQLDKTQIEYLSNIDNSAHVMMGNIENLLELMQIESGAAVYKEQEFYPFEELERLSSETCVVAKNHKRHIFFIIDPRLPQIMMGDFEKIKRVLTNLISNAMKFSKEEDGKIIVELKARYNNESVLVEYAVSDNGIGIAHDRLKTLLRPFAAVYDKQRVAQEGIGIGLNLSHKLLMLLNSQLRVKSQLGKGSRFSFEVVHKIVQKISYEFVAGTKVCIWGEDVGAQMQLKVLENYLKKFEVEVGVVDGLANKELSEASAFFILTNYISSSRADVLKAHYPNLQIIQVCHQDATEKCKAIAHKIDGFVVLPLLPQKLYNALQVIWKRFPKDIVTQSTLQALDSTLSTAKILVAEDNEINQKLLKTILEQKNYHVTTAPNGEIAVEMFLKEDFDLVLMDIDMPVMDGIVATRILKEYDKKRGVFTPVIALTAHALSGDRERILSAGLDAHLAKPLDREFLLQVIDRYLSEKFAKTSMNDNFV